MDRLGRQRCKAGGPVIDNAEAGYGWSTYPEILQKAGITWKIYQDIGLGLNASQFWGFTDDAYIGNYGDNSLLYFHQYQNAPDGSPLADGAKTGTNINVSGSLFDIFRQDVMNDKLPQVSWVVAPEAYTEHPNWPANYGAWYVSQVLDALTANPKVWSKTAFFLTYDENDGFFDHIVPPTPPQSRAEGISTVGNTNEIYPGDPDNSSGPYGLGVRVPMVVISPWSKGGYVNSQVFDHTSLIRFLEQRFGLNEPNITKWRRTVSGDLTSAFNFNNPNDATVPLPSTVSYAPPDNQRHPDYVPTVPTSQALPNQEPGTRPARALPYEFQVDGEAHANTGTVTIRFENTGEAGAFFQVRSGDGATGPWAYTVAAHAEASDTYTLGNGSYDYSVYGANGFLRALKGSFSPDAANLQIKASYEKDTPGITLEIRNLSSSTVRVSVQSFYNGHTISHKIESGESRSEFWQLRDSYGWYDLTVTVDSDPSFQRRFAGHVETGKDSMSDPAIAL